MRARARTYVRTRAHVHSGDRPRQAPSGSVRSRDRATSQSAWAASAMGPWPGCICAVLNAECPNFRPGPAPLKLVCGLELQLGLVHVRTRGILGGEIPPHSHLQLGRQFPHGRVRVCDAPSSRPRTGMRALALTQWRDWQLPARRDARTRR